MKVTELHTLLRNLGVSYQANKDQLVKRLIVKYSQIYEQYSKGLVPYEEAKRYGDWINDNNIVYVPPTPPITPAKAQSPSTSITRTKPIVINVPHSQSSYGGDLSSYQSASTSQYSTTNNYYNYNVYTQQSNSVNGYSSNNHGINNPLYKAVAGYAPSGSLKSSSIDITHKSPPELIFPKRYFFMRLHFSQ